jgi:hypothetical protein
MTFRDHVRKAIDYAIRIALISIVAVPFWLCAWFGGMHPGREDPQADVISGIIAVPGFIFLSPAYGVVKLLSFAHIPFLMPFDLFYFLAACISVPVFWGGFLYCLVQLCRYGFSGRRI